MSDTVRTMPGASRFRAGLLFDLTGQVALVTGAGQGLGLAIAAALALAGATVALVGRDERKLAAAVALIEEKGGSATALPCDLLDPSAAARLATDAVARFGRIDVLVNNAGVQARSGFLSVTDETWAAMLGTHMTAPFVLSRAVLGPMIERRSGKIINVVSVLAELGRPMVVPYAAAKGGLRMLTRALAAEVAAHNIQVNAIGPGYFATEMNRDIMSDPDYSAFVQRRVPAGRWACPDELAGAAIFLASKASSYVSGQVLFVDGGLSASF